MAGVNCMNSSLQKGLNGLADCRGVWGAGRLGNMSENGESGAGARVSFPPWPPPPPRPADDACYSALKSKGRPLRRPLLHRRHLHRHLLPAGVPGEDAQARELPLLPVRRPGRDRRLSPLPALPAGAGAALADAGQRRRRGGLVVHRRLGHPGPPGGRAAGRAGTLAGQRTVADAAGPAPGRQRPPCAAHLRDRVRRLAAAIPANPPAADGQATADRHRPGRHPGGPRGRLRQPAPLQRRLCAALWPEPHATAPQQQRRRAGARRHAGHHHAGRLPAALRRGGHAELPACAAAAGRGVPAAQPPGRALRPHAAADACWQDLHRLAAGPLHRGAPPGRGAIGGQPAGRAAAGDGAAARHAGPGRRPAGHQRRAGPGVPRRQRPARARHHGRL